MHKEPRANATPRTQTSTHCISSNRETITKSEIQPPRDSEPWDGSAAPGDARLQPGHSSGCVGQPWPATPQYFTLPNRKKIRNSSQFPWNPVCATIQGTVSQGTTPTFAFLCVLHSRMGSLGPAPLQSFFGYRKNQEGEMWKRGSDHRSHEEIPTEQNRRIKLTLLQSFGGWRQGNCSLDKPRRAESPQRPLTQASIRKHPSPHRRRAPKPPLPTASPALSPRHQNRCGRAQSRREADGAIRTPETSPAMGKGAIPCGDPSYGPETSAAEPSGAEPPESRSTEPAAPLARASYEAPAPQTPPVTPLPSHRGVPLQTPRGLHPLHPAAQSAFTRARAGFGPVPSRWASLPIFAIKF